MKTNYNPSHRNKNVKLPISLFNAVEGFMSLKGIPNNVDFYRVAIEDPFPPPFVNVNIIGIDGGPASATSALIQVGECLYSWDGKELVQVPEGTALQLIYERERAPQ